MRNLFLSALLCFSCLAEEPGPSLPDAMIIVNASVNNIPMAYDATAGSQLRTDIQKQSRIEILNTTSEVLLVSVGATSCVGAPDNFVVPVGGSNSLWNVRAKKAVCIRSDGSAATTGKVYLSIW
jgi:hypothetical protein